MAGDWIPVRTGLEDEPEVVRIVGALCAQSGRNLGARAETTTLVLGALQRTWSLFDRHSEDGTLHGYTSEWLDATVGIEGWSENLQHVGWLEVHTQALVMQGFESWLSNSSKRRLSENKRKASYKKKGAQKGAQKAPQKRLTEEKRREEKNTRERERETREEVHFGESQEPISKWFRYVFERDSRHPPETVRDTVSMSMLRFANENSAAELLARVNESIAGGCARNEPWFSSKSKVSKKKLDFTGF